MKWNGSVAVVTGASRGIGRAVAEAAAAKGAAVGLIARSVDDLKDLAARLPTQTVVAGADISDRDAVEEAFRRIERELGSIDVLVNNAGIGAYQAFVDEDVATIERLVRTNFMGPVYATKAVLPGMIARRRGHIVTIGSIAGRMGAPFEAAYAATKFAGTALSEALAVELSGVGVGVSLVNPGVVETDFFEARDHAYHRSWPRKISPERVAKATIKAVERNQLEVFVPGWLRLTYVLRTLFPAFFLPGAKRALADDVKEFDNTHPAEHREHDKPQDVARAPQQDASEKI